MKRMPDSAVEQARKLIFEDGLTCKDASKIVGFNEALISKRLKALGFSIPANRNGRNKIELPINEIADLYNSGISEQAIAKKFKVSRCSIRDRLLSHGVSIRTPSEASKVSASFFTPEQRKARAKAANIASKGSKERPESRIKRAIHLENNAYDHITGKGELELIDVLKGRGIDFVWQKAMYKYSLDFLIDNVALELKSGTQYRGNVDIKKGRIKYLKDNGITTIYVLFETVDFMLENVDYILDQINKENSNPVEKGCYKIIIFKYDRFDRFRNSLGRFDAVEKEPTPVAKVLTRKY